MPRCCCSRSPKAWRSSAVMVALACIPGPGPWAIVPVMDMVRGGGGFVTARSPGPPQWRRAACMPRGRAPVQAARKSRRGSIMRSKLLRFGKGFRVAFTARKAQAAEMVIAPGDSAGGPDNRHHGADQWLYVVSGSGVAIVDGRRVPLKAGRLLVIERGERH